MRFGGEGLSLIVIFCGLYPQIRKFERSKRVFGDYDLRSISSESTPVKISPVELEGVSELIVKRLAFYCNDLE